MSNLLEKASILLTPTAYDDGRMLSVKPAIALGEELIVNGNFSDGSTGWTKSANWDISNSKANCSGGAAQLLYQSNILPLGTKYKLTVTVSNYSQGYLSAYGGDWDTELIESNGTFTRYTKSQSVNTGFVGNGFIGSIDNVSIKEDLSGDFNFTRNSSATRVNSQGLIEDMQILSGDLVSNGNFSELGSELVTNGDFATDSDWSKGTGWSIANGKASNDGSASGNSYLINSASASTIGKTYKVVFTVSNYVQGNLRVRAGQASSAYVTANGTYTQYQVSTNTETVRVHAKDNFTGSIDNVSVKQVDPNNNWTITNDYSFGENKVIYSDVSSNSVLYQSGLDLKSGHKYKLKFTVELSTANPASIWIGNSAGSVNYTGTNYVFYPTGSQTVTFTMPSNQTSLALYARSTGGAFSIDNISLIEITNDTNLPRIDYSPYSGVGTCGHWLLEPQSTNTVTYSENFSQYVPAQITTPIQSGFLAPDGTNTAYKITGVIGSSSLYLPGVTSTTATRSIWARTVSGTGTAKLMSYFENTNNLFTITEQWQRFELTGSIVGGGANFYAIDFRSSQTLSEVIIWGAQAEALSYATSYIPTSGSTVTRNAEAANGAGNSSLINSTEGVLYVEIAALSNNLEYKILSVSDGGTNNRAYLQYTNISNQIKFVYKVGGATQAGIGTATFDIVDYHKIACKWKANNFALWIDGNEIGTDTNGSVNSAGTFTQVNFDDGNGNSDFYGKVKTLAVFKEALSDAELTCLTSTSTSNREIFLNYYYRMQYVGANTEALSCAEQTFNI